MTGRFAGKVALVTGASSGIGRASAIAFAREGAKVVVSDIVDESKDETVPAIKAAGGEAIYVQADVSKATDVERLINVAVRTFGRLDCAHNNAGIFGNFAPTADCTEENWDRVVNTNLKGCWLCMKYEIPQMLKQGGGAIVNTSSFAGLYGSPAAPAYCASKGGIVQVTRTAALEYATAGIRINAVCPGSIRTPLVESLIAAGYPETQMAANHPVNRIGEPHEIAEAVLWLCSDAASFVTGVPMPVDGGWSAM
ncbi:MAG: SDR family oxidoreductase [Chloroflexota bacterium]|nr:MAG: SDR family oxidoreductase [Chloroflexota bacterium]